MADPQDPSLRYIHTVAHMQDDGSAGGRVGTLSGGMIGAFSRPSGNLEAKPHVGEALSSDKFSC
jgi:hypothetical protein